MSNPENTAPMGAIDAADNLAHGDLAYVRALAEEGAHAPLVGGAHYVIWGGLIGTAGFLSWLNAIDIISLGALQLPMWVGAFVLGWIFSLTFGARSGSKPGANTMGNRTANSVWFAVGIFMTSFWLTLMVVHDRFTEFGVPPYFLFNLMFPISFGVFGVAFYATAVASRVEWLKGVSLASLLFSILSLAFLGSATQALVSTLGVFICCVVPGIILMRRAPQDIV